MADRLARERYETGDSGKPTHQEGCCFRHRVDGKVKLSRKTRSKQSLVKQDLKS